MFLLNKIHLKKVAPGLLRVLVPGLVCLFSLGVAAADNRDNPNAWTGRECDEYGIRLRRIPEHGGLGLLCPAWLAPYVKSLPPTKKERQRAQAAQSR